MNNCRTPLKLKWDGIVTNQYKVNKPNDQSGLYVSKKVADDLLNALCDLRARCLADDSEFNLPIANEAIDNALKEE
jgi:hypothetical protein